MNADVLYAGIFGVFTTLLGGGAAYLLSFSKDERQRREELKSIYSALAIELKIIASRLSQDETHIPRFGSMNVFIIRGFSLHTPIELSIALENIASDLQRIEDITKEDHAFNVAVASSGNVEIEYRNVSQKNERANLIKSILVEIPEVIKKLKEHT